MTAPLTSPVHLSHPPHSQRKRRSALLFVNEKTEAIFCLRTVKHPGFSAHYPFSFLFWPYRFLLILTFELQIQFLREAVTLTTAKIVYILSLYYIALISI